MGDAQVVRKYYFCARTSFFLAPLAVVIALTSPWRSTSASNRFSGVFGFTISFVFATVSIMGHITIFGLAQRARENLIVSDNLWGFQVLINGNVKSNISISRSIAKCKSGSRGAGTGS